MNVLDGFFLIVIVFLCTRNVIGTKKEFYFFFYIFISNLFA